MLKLLHCRYDLFDHTYTVWKHEHNDKMESCIRYKRRTTYTATSNFQEMLGILQQGIN